MNKSEIVRTCKGIVKWFSPFIILIFAIYLLPEYKLMALLLGVLNVIVLFFLLKEFMLFKKDKNTINNLLARFSVAKEKKIILIEDIWLKYDKNIVKGVSRIDDSLLLSFLDVDCEGIYVKFMRTLNIPPIFIDWKHISFLKIGFIDTESISQFSAECIFSDSDFLFIIPWSDSFNSFIPDSIGVDKI